MKKEKDTFGLWCVPENIWMCVVIKKFTCVEEFNKFISITIAFQIIFKPIRFSFYFKGKNNIWSKVNLKSLTLYKLLSCKYSFRHIEDTIVSNYFWYAISVINVKRKFLLLEPTLISSGIEIIWSSTIKIKKQLARKMLHGLSWNFRGLKKCIYFQIF